MKLSIRGRHIVKILGNVITFICVLMIVWGILSFIDVNLNNGFGGTGPSDWNVFKILVEWRNAR